MVSAGQLHALSTLPAGAVEDAGFVRVGAAGHDDLAVDIHGDTGAEHVVLGVGHIGLDDVLGARVPCRGEGGTTGRGKELVIRPGRPENDVVDFTIETGCVGTCHGDNGQVEGWAPSTLVWVVEDGVIGGVDVDIDDAGPGVLPFLLGVCQGRRFTLSNELHVFGSLCFEDRDFDALVPSPGTKCDLVPVVSILAEEDLVRANLSTGSVVQDRKHAEAVHILLLGQGDDNIVPVGSGVAVAAPVRLDQTVLCIITLVACVFTGAGQGERASVEPGTLVRLGLPEVLLGIDGTLGGNMDVTRIRSKRKGNVGRRVSVADSSPEKETRGPLELHLGNKPTNNGVV